MASCPFLLLPWGLEGLRALAFGPLPPRAGSSQGASLSILSESRRCLSPPPTVHADARDHLKPSLIGPPFLQNPVKLISRLFLSRDCCFTSNTRSKQRGLRELGSQIRLWEVGGTGPGISSCETLVSEVLAQSGRGLGPTAPPGVKERGWALGSRTEPWAPGARPKAPPRAPAGCSQCFTPPVPSGDSPPACLGRPCGRQPTLVVRLPPPVCSWFRLLETHLFGAQKSLEPSQPPWVLSGREP